MDCRRDLGSYEVEGGLRMHPLDPMLIHSLVSFWCYCQLVIGFLVGPCLDDFHHCRELIWVSCINGLGTPCSFILKQSMIYLKEGHLCHDILGRGPFMSWYIWKRVIYIMIYLEEGHLGLVASRNGTFRVQCIQKDFDKFEPLSSSRMSPLKKMLQTNYWIFLFVIECDVWIQFFWVWCVDSVFSCDMWIHTLISYMMVEMKSVTTTELLKNLHKDFCKRGISLHGQFTNLKYLFTSIWTSILDNPSIIGKHIVENCHVRENVI